MSSPEEISCRFATSVGLDGCAKFDREVRPSEETGLSVCCCEETAKQEGLSLLCLTSRAHQGPLRLPIA